MLYFLREGIGQPRESAHAHTHRQIAALDKRRGNVFVVWFADDPALARSAAFRRAVAAFITLALRCAVELDQHSVIYVPAEGVLDGNDVRLMTVSGQLDPVRQATGEVVNKAVGRLLVAAINTVSRDQFGVGAKCGPGIYVPEPERAAILGRDVLFLCIAEGPNLIALDALALEVGKCAVLVNSTGIAKLN